MRVKFSQISYAENRLTYLGGAEALQAAIQSANEAVENRDQQNFEAEQKKDDRLEELRKNDGNWQESLDALDGLKKSAENELKNVTQKEWKKLFENIATLDSDSALEKFEINRVLELAKASQSLEKDVSKTSTLELQTLATTETGREKMREKFTSGEVAVGQEIAVNFGNQSAEWSIGAGDLLPVTVREITVKDVEGNERTGERRASPRPGYYDAAGYIPIFSGDTITVTGIGEPTEKQLQIWKTEERDVREKNFAEFQKDHAEAQKLLQEIFPSESEVAAENVAEKLLSLTGREVWKLRKNLGAEKLAEVIRAAGLENQKVDFSKIAENNPELQKILDQLPKNMAAGVMGIESRQKQFAVSPTGALGCMQLTKWIYHDFGNTEPINPFDPKQAVTRAAEHLLETYQQTGSEAEAVKIYNGGPKYWQNPGADPNYFAKYTREKERLATA